jgi:hypothetical protein
MRDEFFSIYWFLNVMKMKKKHLRVGFNEKHVEVEVCTILSTPISVPDGPSGPIM